MKSMNELDIKISKNQIIAPLYVVINITNRCNLKCLHCFNSSSLNTTDNKDELNDDEILALIDELISMGVANVCFSGGEPMLRKKLLFKCIKKLTDKNIRTSIVSNGMLIDTETAEILKLLNVKEVQISLDGSNSKTHEKLRGVSGAFYRAIRAINNLCNVGIITSVSYTLNKWNANEVEEAINLFDDIKISGFNVRPLLPLGEGLSNLNELVPSVHDYRKVAKIIYKLNSMRYKYQLGFNDPISHIYVYRNECTNKVIEVQANGDIYASYCICKTLGNIKEKSLEEYWNGGLNKAWEIKEIRDIATKINCISDLKNV